VVLRGLARRTHTRRQVALSRDERAENLREQIVMRRPLTSDVVLVDDVFTTGATARACFKAMREGGARPLALVAVALAE
jgi:predicted amidophosphoribosyltransferase